MRRTLRFHPTPVRMAKINQITSHEGWQGCGDGHSFTIDGNADWFSNSANQCGEFLKELKLNPPHDKPAIPCVGICPKDSTPATEILAQLCS